MSDFINPIAQFTNKNEDLPSVWITMMVVKIYDNGNMYIINPIAIDDYIEYIPSFLNIKQEVE